MIDLTRRPGAPKRSPGFRPTSAAPRRACRKPAAAIRWRHFGYRLVFRQLLDLGGGLRFLLIGKLNSSKATLTIDRHGRTFFGRADIDIFAENGGRAHIVLSDRCFRKPINDVLGRPSRRLGKTTGHFVRTLLKTCFDTDSDVPHRR